MPFCLTREESFPDGIRRVITEQLQKAASSLPSSGVKPAKVDRGIHEARRSIKKVRGVLRLIQPQLHAAYWAETGQLRALGRRLSDLRDAAVMPEVFDGLQANGGKQFETIHTGLLKDLQELRGRDDLAALLSETRSGLRHIGRRVEDWCVPGDADTVTHSGYSDTYQRGKSALRDAVENPSPETLHRFRAYTALATRPSPFNFRLTLPETTLF